MNYYRKLLAVMLTAGLLATAYPASAATPQAIDSPAFLAQVASVLDTIQKTLRALAAAIQNIVDEDTSENAAATPSPAPSPTFVTPSPTPYSPPSTLSVPVPPPPAPAQLTADEILLERLKIALKRLQEQVVARQAAPASVPQTPAPSVPQTRNQSNLAASPLTRPDGAFVRDPSVREKPQYARDTIIVNFKDTAGEITFRKEGNRVIASKSSITQLLDLHRVPDVKKLVPHLTGPLATTFVVKIPAVSVDSNILAIVDDFAKNPDVAYAEPNYIAYTAQVSTFTNRQVPNDPLYPQQWHLPKVSAPQAWAVTQGNPVPIAIIDTGVRWNHPDLAANIWRNPGEIPNNGIDDDHNGFIDDVRGWDFVETTYSCWPGEDCTVEDNNPDDFQGHGTHVSGIAAAVTNNNVGVAGICQRCKIMPVRAGFAQDLRPAYSEPLGSLETDDIVQAITYAVDNGAKVISMSFGDYYDSQTQRFALQYAFTRRVMLVGGAGNNSSPTRFYPAAYPEVIAVAASDQNDQKAPFSNYGVWVDVAAPGVDIPSTVIHGVTWGCSDRSLPPDNDGFGLCSGTSMATPLAAGVVGLVLSRIPTLSSDQAFTLIHSAVDSLNTSNYIGEGRINALRATLPSTIPIALLSSAWDDSYLTISSFPPITGTATGPTFLNYTVQLGQGVYPSVWNTLQGITFTPVENGPLTGWIPLPPNTTPGTYTLRLLVMDSANRLYQDRAILDVDITQVIGWPKTVIGPTIAPPSGADIDGNDTTEVFFPALHVTATTDVALHAIDSRGFPLSGGWPIVFPRGATAPGFLFQGSHSLSPAVDNMDGDSSLEVATGASFKDGTTKYFVYEQGGTLQPGWPITLGGNYVNRVNWSSPVIANVDGGVDKEIIFTLEDAAAVCGPSNKVYIYKQNGQPLTGWPQSVPCIPRGTPAVGDLDANGDTEIVVSTFPAPPFTTNGMLYAFNHDGTSFSTGWPQPVANHSSPVLADLDQNDGGKLEVVQAGEDGQLRILNEDGTLVPGWPRPYFPASYAPAIGDIDANGDLEIVFTSCGDGFPCDGPFYLYVVNHDGSPMRGWPIDLGVFTDREPVIADIDGDSIKEIFVPAPLGGKLFGYHANGVPVVNFPKPIRGEMRSPIVGDLNGNGIVDLFALGQLRYPPEVSMMYLWEFSGPARREAFEWPQFHHDAEHTGRYEPYHRPE